MFKKMTMLAFAASALLAAPAAADPIFGTWKTAPGEEGGYLHVIIAACGAAICGTIDKAIDAEGADSGDYEHLGKPIIWDMGSDGGGAYSGGKIWAPDTDKTYKSKLALNGNTLEVKGCVAGGLVCRGQDWTRLN